MTRDAARKAFGRDVARELEALPPRPCFAAPARPTRRPAPPSTLDVASRRAGERDVEEELEQLALEGSAER